MLTPSVMFDAHERCRAKESYAIRDTRDYARLPLFIRYSEALTTITLILYCDTARGAYDEREMMS